MLNNTLDQTPLKCVD